MPRICHVTLWRSAAMRGAWGHVTGTQRWINWLRWVVVPTTVHREGKRCSRKPRFLRTPLSSADVSHDDPIVHGVGSLHEAGDDPKRAKDTGDEHSGRARTLASRPRSCLRGQVGPRDLSAHLPRLCRSREGLILPFCLKTLNRLFFLFLFYFTCLLKKKKKSSES